MGDFNSITGKASNPNENGAEMPMFLRNNETKTLTDRVKRPGPKWTRQRIRKGESSIFDFIVVENGSCKETEVHVCTADVGTTHHCLFVQTVSRQFIIDRRDRKMYRWRIGKIEVKEKQEFQQEVDEMRCNLPSCWKA